MNTETLLDALKFAALILGLGVLALLGGVGLQYLRAAIGEKKYAQLKDWVMSTVRFLEQIGVARGFSNEEMKKQAVSVCLDAASRLKIPMGYDTADILVESMVQIVKSEQVAMIAEEIHDFMEA